MSDQLGDLVVTWRDRPASPEEVRAAITHTPTEEERQAVEELAGWFTRRYPAGADRLAYARRAYQRWMAHRPRLSE